MAKSKSGASKGAKKINAFNDGKLEGVNVSMADAPVWPMEKWPHPTPGQGPLPNTKLPKKGKA